MDNKARTEFLKCTITEVLGELDDLNDKPCEDPTLYGLEEKFLLRKMEMLEAHLNKIEYLIEKEN